MLSQKFLEENIRLSPSVRDREKEPFLRWVDRNAQTSSIAIVLFHQLDQQLVQQFGCSENISCPQSSDEGKIFLLKTARAYLDDCVTFHHNPADGFDPSKGIGYWLMTEGRLWTINDALPQVVTKALHHAYTHETADIEGMPRLNHDQLIRQGFHLK